MSQAQFSRERTAPEGYVSDEGGSLHDRDNGGHDIDLDRDYDMEEDYAGVDSSITYSATLNNDKAVNANDKFTIYKTRGGMQVPAVYHDQIRAELIAEANKRGTYTHKPEEEGTQPTDVTAFCLDQAEWEEKGAGRPELLKSFVKPQNFTNPTYNPGYMYFNGFLVIDHKDQPLKPFRGIPLTLSSKLEGWRAEAIRRADPRIRNMDLMVRMPVKVEPSANGIPTREPVVKENTVAGRQSRFREQAGAVTWGRGGSTKAHDFLWALLPQHCKDNNLALPRDLTSQERGQFLLLNIGKKPERARKVKTDKGMTREEYIDGVRTRAAGRQAPRGGNPRRLRKEIVRGVRRESTAETQPGASASHQAESELAEEDAMLPDSPTSGLVEEYVHYQADSLAPAAIATSAPIVTPITFAALAALAAPAAPVTTATPVTYAAPIILTAPVAPMVPVTSPTVSTAVALPVPPPVALPSTVTLLPPALRVPALLSRGRGSANPPFPFVRPGEYLFNEYTKIF